MDFPAISYSNALQTPKLLFTIDSYNALTSLFLALFQEAACLGVFFDHTQNQALLPQHNSLHF